MANYSICIGVSEYQNINSLNYAHKDAEDLHNLFTDKFKFEKTKLFRTNGNSSDYSQGKNPYELASYTNIFNYLCDTFDESIEKTPLTLADNFWFFFSGHGREFKGKHYLLPCDVSRRNTALERTALAVEDIAYRLHEYSGAGNIIMLMDACRESGGKAIGTPFNTQRGIITIASCEPKGYSYEIQELENGSFTYALLQSLQGLTDDNCATVERLMNSLSRQVPEINLKYKAGEQKPYAKLEPHSKYNLFLLPQYIQPSLPDIEQLEKDAWKALAKRDLDDAEIMWRSLIKFNTDEAINTLIEIDRIRQKREDNSIPDNISKEETKTKAVANKSVDNIISEDKKPANFTEDLGSGITIEMVYLKGGTFMMGSNESKYEKPIHRVQLKEFYMSKYPITQGQYRAIIGKNPSHFQGKNNPVEKVSWNDAQEFCQQLSAKTGKEYNLPSEAQWEYAARAGSQGKWCFGDDESQLKDYGWYRKNSDRQTHRVGQKKPNQWGLYDLYGNVWQWCEDNWHGNYDQAPSDGSSWTKESSIIHVRRGGSWSNSPNYCRCACRHHNSRDGFNNFIGFRVVCVLPRTY